MTVLFVLGSDFLYGQYKQRLDARNEVGELS
jgi:hypothetical protein